MAWIQGIKALICLQTNCFAFGSKSLSTPSSAVGSRNRHVAALASQRYRIVSQKDSALDVLFNQTRTPVVVLSFKSTAQRISRSCRMNGFSTEEDSHDGPPAPPFYGQSCCLIEDGERCGRSAGNASFSKRIQKSISQKKLKLDIDKSVSGPACVRETRWPVQTRVCKLALRGSEVQLSAKVS